MRTLVKPKILVVGNFMMDLISSGTRLPNMGETVIGTDFRTAPGGKGINQAVQCARLGAEVTMAGCVGDDAFGKEMLQAAELSGVDISRVKISDRHASGVGNVQLEIKENNAQNRILVIPGANYDLEIQDLGWLENEISDYDMVMLQLEMTMEITKFVAECAHRAGIPVMLNPAPAGALDDELLSCITYLSPNEHEAALLSGHPLRSDVSGINRDDLNQVNRVLKDKGVKKLIVTLGGNGSVLCDDENMIFTDCVKMPEVKDPTAAGDSFVGAFCTGITAGLTEKEALSFASHVAAITVSGMGAMPSLPNIQSVQQLMREREFADFDPSLFDDLK